MNEERLERRAHWFQIVVGLIIAATAWCVKLQMSLNDVRNDVEAFKANAQHYREERGKKDLENEHRLTALEAHKSG